MVALRNLHHNVIKGRSKIIIKCSGPVLQSGPVYQCGLNWVLVILTESLFLPFGIGT